MEHKPVFPVSHYSKFIEGFGANVVEGGVKDIRNAKAYILAGVTESFNEEEVEEIANFVESGGKLIILIHIPPKNLNELLERFEIDVSQVPYEVFEVSAVPGINNSITKGIKEIYMKGVFPVNGNLFVVKREEMIFFGGITGVAKILTSSLH